MLTLVVVVENHGDVGWSKGYGNHPFCSAWDDIYNVRLREWHDRKRMVTKPLSGSMHENPTAHLH